MTTNLNALFSRPFDSEAIIRGMREADVVTLKGDDLGTVDGYFTLYGTRLFPQMIAAQGYFAPEQLVVLANGGEIPSETPTPLVEYQLTVSFKPEHADVALAIDCCKQAKGSHEFGTDWAELFRGEDESEEDDSEEA